MIHIDHSTLAAYVDGELDSEMAHAVEAHLQNDEAAQAYVDQLRTLNGLTKMAYNTPMHDQPPQQLIDTILKAEATPSAATQTIAFATFEWRRMAPLAAGVVGLLLGTFGATTYIDYSTKQAVSYQTAQAASDNRAIEASLNQALEMNVSGKSVTWHNPDSGKTAQLTPVRTFQKEDKTYCREYKKEIVDNGNKDVSFGIACREPQGSWTTKYIIQDLSPERGL